MNRAVMQQALEALAIYQEHDPEGNGVADNAITALRAALAEPEQDWKDLYAKEKQRADMWRDKYEAVAGPDERVYPQTVEPEQAFDLCDVCGLRTLMPEAAPTPRKPEQECDKDPRGCWSVRCQLGKKCKNAPTPRSPDELRQEYERGFIDGMSKQTERSVDRTVNAMSREWVGLTEEEVWEIPTLSDFARAIEAKLKEKNT